MRSSLVVLVLLGVCVAHVAAMGESCDELKSWPKDKIAMHVLKVAETNGAAAASELARISTCFVPIKLTGSPSYSWEYKPSSKYARSECQTWGEILHRGAVFHKSAHFEPDNIAEHRDLPNTWGDIRENEQWPREPVDAEGDDLSVERLVRVYPKSLFEGTMKGCMELFGGFHIRRESPTSPFVRVVAPMEVIGTPADACKPVRDAVTGETLFGFMQAAFGSRDDGWVAELAKHRDGKLAALASAVQTLDPKGDWASVVLKTLQCAAPLDRAQNGQKLHKVAKCDAVEYAYTGFAAMVATHEMTQHGGVDGMLRWALEDVYDKKEPKVMMQIREIWSLCQPEIPQRELGMSRPAAKEGGVRVRVSVADNLPRDILEKDEAIYTPIFCRSGKHTSGQSVLLRSGESVDLAFSPSRWEEPQGIYCRLSGAPGRTRSYLRNGQAQMCSIEMSFRKFKYWPHVLRVDNIEGGNCPYRWVDLSDTRNTETVDNRYHFHLELKKPHPEIADSVEKPKLPHIAETSAADLYKQLADWSCAQVRAMTPAQFRTMFHKLVVDDDSSALEYMRHQLHGVRKLLTCARGELYDWDSEWVEAPGSSQCKRMWDAVNEAGMVFDLRMQTESFSQNAMELIIDEWRTRKAALTPAERAVALGDLPEYDQKFSRKDGKPLTLLQWEKINGFVDKWLESTAALGQCDALLNWNTLDPFPTRPEMYMAFTFVNNADVDLSWFEVAPVYGREPHPLAKFNGKVGTLLNKGKLPSGEKFVQLFEPDGRTPQQGMAEVLFSKTAVKSCRHTSATLKRLGTLPVAVYNNKEHAETCPYGWYIVQEQSTLNDVVIEFRKRKEGESVASLFKVKKE